MRPLLKQWSAVEAVNDRFRVPRSSDLKLWLRSHDINQAHLSTVQTWPDASGNNAAATQGTAGKRPIYSGNDWHGFPLVEFDGIDDEMAAPLTADDSRTIFVVAGKASPPGAANQICLAIGDVNARLMTNSTLGTGWLFWNGVIATELEGGGDPQQMSCIALRWQSASVLQAFVNGGQTVTIDPAAAGGTTITMGAVVSSDFGDYSFLELLAYDRPLLDADMSKVHNYLSRKYSLGF